MANELIDNSKKILAMFDGKAKQALEAVGMVAEGYAKRKTPVDTGRLRNSITYAVDGDSVYIGSNVEYAPFVELGTSRMDGFHMLQDAATKHSNTYKRLIDDIIIRD